MLHTVMSTGDDTDSLTRFGAPRLVTRTCVQATYPDQHIPLATFAFKYRSRGLLEALFMFERDLTRDSCPTNYRSDSTRPSCNST